MTKNRLEAFSDGVFSIVITLLILNVKIPEANNLDNGKLIHFLLGSLPNIITFLFTFLVVGVFWVAHHRIFAFVKVVDTTLLWLNIFYLMFIAVIPFPASLLAKYPDLPTSILLYSGTLFTIGIFHLILLWHIYRSDKLRDAGIEPGVFVSARNLSLVGPVCYVAASALSNARHYLSFIFIIGALLFYIFFAGKAKVSQHLVEHGAENTDKEDDE